MKIAIPTQDGIMIAPYLGRPKGFLVLTIELGEIVNEEIRWNILSDILTSEDGYMYNLKDCSVIIAQEISDRVCKWLKLKQIQVICSKEVIITKIVMDYLTTTLVRESNTCCSP